MYTMDELNDKLLSELKNITVSWESRSQNSQARSIYKILDEKPSPSLKKVLIKSQQRRLNLRINQEVLTWEKAIKAY